VSEFRPLAFAAVRDEMVKLGWARRSINRHMGGIDRVIRWGVSQEIVAPDVLHALASVPGLRVGRTEAKDPPPVEPVAPDRVEATLPHLPATVRAMGTLVRWARESGLDPYRREPRRFVQRVALAIGGAP